MKKILLAGVAGAVMTMAGGVWAQTQVADNTQTNPASVQELVVTALKRDQKVFDVPAVVTVLSGAQVNNYRLQDARDLLTMVPTAFLQEINAGTARDINIRGVGTPNLFAESGVAMYVDDIFSSDFISYPTQFYDLDRLEVLQGPQGGLYGRNAVGGVVNFISHQPDDQYEGYVRASYGTYNRYELEGMANIPISQDLGVRIVGWRTDQTRGEYFNEFLHEYIDANNSDGGRIVVRATPTANLTLSLVAEASEANTPGTNLFFPDSGETMTTIMRDTEPTNHYSTGRLAGQADYKTTAGEFTLIAGYRNYVLTGVEDTDLTAVAANQNVTTRKNSVHSDYLEGRWLSPDIGPFSILAGADYLHSNAIGDVFGDLIGLSNSTGMSDTLTFGNNQGVNSWAVFAQPTWKILPTLTLSGDIRYTDDTKRLNFLFAPSPAFTALVPSFQPAALITSRTFTRWSPGATLTWAPIEDWRAYATVQTGFRAGGFNFNVGKIQDLPYNPETSINYEAGVKHQFHNGYVDLDGFIFDQSNVLIFQFDLTAPGPLGGFLANVGSARTYGIEADAGYRLFPGLDLSATLGWLDAKFTSGTTAFFGAVASNELPTSRPFTASATADYRHPVANDLDFVFDGSYSHRAGGWEDAANTFRLDGLDLLNLRAGVDYRHHLELTGYVQNLLNDRNVIASGGFETPTVPNPQFGGSGVTLAPGRTYGIELKASF